MRVALVNPNRIRPPIPPPGLEYAVFDPDRPDRNRNYNANEVLVRAIRVGYRGACWDILRRVRDR